MEPVLEPADHEARFGLQLIDAGSVIHDVRQRSQVLDFSNFPRITDLAQG